MSEDDIKQRRKCRCCNKQYDYAVPGSHSTRFICEDCGQIPEALRKVLIAFNKRLTDLETQVKAAIPKKSTGSQPANQ